jgi:predicted acylesterase/phospholipase RssA
LTGRQLADGGLRAVLPLELARRVPADRVVAIDVGPGFDEPPPAERARIPALIRAHGAAIRIMMAAQTERAIAAWPKDAARLIVVRAVAEREATFAVAGAQRYLRAGYEATTQALG